MTSQIAKRAAARHREAILLSTKNYSVYLYSLDDGWSGPDNYSSSMTAPDKIALDLDIKIMQAVTDEGDYDTDEPPTQLSDGPSGFRKIQKVDDISQIYWNIDKDMMEILTSPPPPGVNVHGGDYSDPCPGSGPGYVAWASYRPTDWMLVFQKA
jgi:hypothetical protein